MPLGLHRFLAFDLGAESGRAVVGTLKDGCLSIEEVSRFPNEPVQVHNTLYWDVLGLYNQVLKGLREFARRYADSVEGVGIDTWAVDFGLLDREGKLLQNPVHYRDHRTDGVVEEMGRRITPEELFQRTGIAASQIYTSVQLRSLRRSRSPLLECAARLQMMPDLLTYFLTGEGPCERTQAITSQLYDPRKGQWNEDVMRRLDLPPAIMPGLVDPGTVIGEIDERIKRNTGLKRSAVIAPCTHDTASAVAAVPAQGADWVFLSSGTWSLLGAITREVCTSPEAFAAGVVNEMTLGGFLLLHGIMGLWLLQQVRAVWHRQGETYSHDDLVRLAEQVPQAGALVDPNDTRFLAPSDMLQAIGQYCIETGQHPPEGPGETARCILESLALTYRRGLDQLARILNRRFNVLHIVGGGSKNSLLCQLTANATGLAVVAGPSEATVAGNVLVQALARGYVSCPAEIRAIVRRSTETVEYVPQDTRRSEERYGEYSRILHKARR